MVVEKEKVVVVKQEKNVERKVLVAEEEEEEVELKEVEVQKVKWGWGCKRSRYGGVEGSSKVGSGGGEKGSNGDQGRGVGGGVVGEGPEA